MKKFIWFILFLLLPVLSHAQALPYLVHTGASSAEYRICTFPANAEPCTNYATIYGNPAETDILPNPYQSLMGGTLLVYLAPGNYSLQVNGEPQYDEIIVYTSGGGTTYFANLTAGINTNGAFGISPTSTSVVPLTLTIPNGSSEDILDLYNSATQEAVVTSAGEVKAQSFSTFSSGVFLAQGYESSCGSVPTGSPVQDYMCLGDSTRHDAMLTYSGGAAWWPPALTSGSVTAGHCAEWLSDNPPLLEDAGAACGSGSSSGVSSFSGDSAFAINSASTGAVTLALHTAGAYNVWGNNTNATAAPAYSALSAWPASAFPTLNQNTTGTAANLSGTPALPNGTTATTQSAGDNTTKLATDAFVIANAGGDSISNVQLSDEFCGNIKTIGTSTYQAIGSLNWTVNNQGTATATGTGDVNHPCVAQLLTTSTSGNYQNVQLLESSMPLDSMVFDSTFVIRAAQITSTEMEAGFVGSSANIDVSFNTSLSDTDWMYETCSGGTCTRTSSGIAPVAGDWVKIRIRSTTAGTILFSMCQASGSSGCTLGSETSQSTNVPAIAMDPWFDVGTLTAVVAKLDVNFFSFVAAVTR